ncbi:uncharacterized protein [Anabrus simplex]|uniref:uncharacterized protein n=1 Tax=Anabrus simplex TaxID=316456 RepID=UPI0035A3A1AC
MDIKTCISELRNKIYTDKSKLTAPDVENKRNCNISVQDGLFVPSTRRNDIIDICRDANDQTTQKLCKKKEEKLTVSIYPAATRTKDLPLKEINKNLNYPLIDIREREKEKLRKVLIYGGEFGFGENSTEPQSGKRMVRYGEYSPRNPNIIPSDRHLLALGEYEERRRQLMEQKKREYLEQLNQLQKLETSDDDDDDDDDDNHS